jgi:hypothetical protein
MPALLNNRSTRPHAFTVAANKASTDAGSVTSVGTASALPGASASVATCSSGSLRRPAIATRQPSRSNASAAALPTPVPPPVTTATFPLDVLKGM